MALDYATLELLRQNHPAWRLLCAHHAPLVAGFLHWVFIVPSVRNLSQAVLDEVHHGAVALASRISKRLRCIWLLSKHLR
ncbi:DUF3375 family protein [Acidithiobacillus sp. AC3]